VKDLLGYREGVAAERARIRRELLAAIEEEAWNAAGSAQLPKLLVVDLDEIRAALDKIVPEEVSNNG
jgi:hypothetical protein